MVETFTYFAFFFNYIASKKRLKYTFLYKRDLWTYKIRNAPKSVYLKLCKEKKL